MERSAAYSSSPWRVGAAAGALAFVACAGLLPLNPCRAVPCRAVPCRVSTATPKPCRAEALPCTGACPSCGLALLPFPPTVRPYGATHALTVHCGKLTPPDRRSAHTMVTDGIIVSSSKEACPACATVAARRTAQPRSYTVALSQVTIQ